MNVATDSSVWALLSHAYAFQLLNPIGGVAAALVPAALGPVTPAAALAVLAPLAVLVPLAALAMLAPPAMAASISTPLRPVASPARRSRDRAACVVAELRDVRELRIFTTPHL
jgi:hypothetical protein